MAQKQRKIIHVDALRPGMILSAASARGNPLRRIYKVVTKWSDYHSEWSSEVWSIQVRWNVRKRVWEEECCMVSNTISRISHVVEMVDGKPNKIPVTIVERDPTAKGPQDDAPTYDGRSSSGISAENPCGSGA